ncbi:MAG: heavy metal translocating P-type ATPase [Helicobacteraceae bacterium]
MPKQNIQLNISGMTCANCAGAIERVAKKLPGVEEARVSFASSGASFIYDDALVKKEQIVEKIEKLGYKVIGSSLDLESARLRDLASLKRDFFIALFLSLAVMAGMNFGWLNKWNVLALASIVQFVIGKRFYAHAFGALRHSNYDMNVLVALGTTAAYGYSALVVLTPHIFPPHLRYMYFDGAMMIITFILLGKFLEEKSKARATDFLKDLLDLSPKMATLLQGEQETQVAASSLAPGDIVAVRSGEAISADGIIIQGEADVDTSMITGEPLPAFKKVGDEVIAGTINKTGFLKVRVTRAAQDSMLSKIVGLLNEAQSQKMPIGRFADRVSNVFVPFVIAAALVAFFAWYIVTGNFLSAFLAFVSVLVVSCPCALGLATPIAIVNAISRAAKSGILIKNPEILEQRGIKYAVFDKTGTLTSGKLSVKACSISDAKILELVLALEKRSEHPISKAIVKFIESGVDPSARQRSSELDVQDLIIRPGRGISARVGGQDLIIGNEAFLKEQASGEIPQEARGKILVALGRKFCGSFEIEDKIKESSFELIADLKKLGITPIMLTGDSAAAAADVAQRLGITEIFSQVLPNEKLQIIKNLQKKAKVLFVGDGINDSLSLKQAHVGIALSSGADIAKEAGDVVLINQNMQAVKSTILLSKKSMRLIKQNLFWAFFYNAVGIPLAAGVFYPLFGVMLTPMFAGMAMSFSSLTVVLNSLRLKFAKL